MPLGESRSRQMDARLMAMLYEEGLIDERKSKGVGPDGVNEDM